MDLKIADIRKKDYKKAIQFAIKGMHFDWYLEINRATQIFAAYADDDFVGVLLAQIYSEPKKHNNLLQKLYVKLIDIFQKLLFKDGAGLYEKTTKIQLKHYLETNKPDGEIIFLAADPDCKIKGIGTALLKALEEKEQGKTIFLHTDDACTYQFYEHRGFERVEETDIILEMPKGEVPLKCLLYSKKI